MKNAQLCVTMLSTMIYNVINAECRQAECRSASAAFENIMEKNKLCHTVTFFSFWH